MDIEEIINFHNNFKFSDYSLSNEEIGILCNSLIILQNENHFKKIFFWGKVFGIKNDYYIAFGYVKNIIYDRIYYYSIDAVNWGLLPKLSEKNMDYFSISLYQGDPSYTEDIEVKFANFNWSNSKTNNSQFETIKKLLKEEDRLSSLVHRIQNDSFIMPRGALIKTSNGCILDNVMFKGLTKNESINLSSYFHFRKPQFGFEKHLLSCQDYNYSLDILDPIDNSFTKSWVIHLNNNVPVTVIIKSLKWHGMNFYHKINTNNYGCIYFGHGKENLGMPFMLP